MINFADLHLHTNESDGEYSPEAVVRAAKAQGFKAISLTDHDTINGLDKARQISKEVNIELINGVEISTVWGDKEIHILGYLFDLNNKDLTNQLELMRSSRKERIKKTVYRLNELGYDVKLERVWQLSGMGAIGRPHVAKALLEKGYVNTIKEAFSKFLSPGCSAYIPRYKITPSQAIQLILNAGGIPVLAHPRVNPDDEIIPYLKELGLLGIEVWHPEHDNISVRKYYKIAQENGLLITGGSDWHGNNKDIGFSLGSIKLDYVYVERLKQKKAELLL